MTQAPLYSLNMFGMLAHTLTETFPGRFCNIKRGFLPVRLRRPTAAQHVLQVRISTQSMDMIAIIVAFLLSAGAEHRLSLLQLPGTLALGVL